LQSQRIGGEPELEIDVRAVAGPRETGEIRTSARHGGRQVIGPPLDLLFKPGKPSAREHRVDAMGVAAYRVTLTSRPAARISPTAIVATLRSNRNSSRAKAAIAASALDAAGASTADTEKLAPSPPNTKGNGRRLRALTTAVITPAPTMFTDL
jgi:hypothetical protein